MGMKINAELPLPANLKAEYPLPKELAEIKKKRDAEIREIFEGKSDKFVVIVGPCSADNEDSVCDYVNRLAKVNEKVSDRLMIIPRIYTNKPRTTGEGYKGMPFFSNSSRRIASDSRTASKRSRVIAPGQRTPSPGPGNG